MKALPIGRDNFKDIIELGCYYVDKTKAIEEILERKAYVTLFPRPRRFGKSLLISTIDHFFNAEEKEENKELFKDLYISKSKYAEMQGTRPVIKLNFKNFQSDRWDDMYSGIREEMRQLYQSKSYLKNILEEKEKELFDKYLSKTADEMEYKQSIKNLSQYMKRYYGEKPILLIDEYDVPIQNGYIYGFYNDIVGFIKSLFNNGLKSNDSIEFAIMTGVLRVSKESIFSDLNNVAIYSIMDEKYDEYFGFTEEETKELLEYYNMDLTDAVKNMYDGYIFGNREIYNPWSILNYVDRGKLWPYWVNTSGDELIKDIFNKAKKETSEMIEDLLLEKSIDCIYNEKITFLDLNSIESNRAKDVAANFLLISGYLTKAKGTELTASGKIKLKIPNNEVKTVFADIVSNWVIDDMNMTSEKLFKISDSLEGNNKELLENVLLDALNHMSFYDSNESFYHGYVLGLFVEYLNRDYVVKSNREGGRGRFDLCIRKRDNSIGIIVEFKVAKSLDELEQVALEGKKQIAEKQYYKELILDGVEEENIKTYAVAFYEKNCKVV